MLGKQQSKIPPLVAQTLIRQAERKELSTLDEAYRGRTARDVVNTITLGVGGKVKTVRYSASARGKIPLMLEGLARDIEIASGVEPWFMVTPRNVTPEMASLTYERLEGCEQCQLYKMTLYENGVLVFEGKDGVREKGMAMLGLQRERVTRIFGTAKELAQLGPTTGGQVRPIERISFIEANSNGLKSHNLTRRASEIVEALHAQENIKVYTAPSIPFLTDPAAFIQLSVQGECFGHCPVFEAVIYADGRLTFLGLKNTRAKGKRTSRIGQKSMSDLRATVNAANPLELDNRYGGGADLGIDLISIRLDGTIKQIYVTGEAPSVLSRLTEKISGILEANGWLQ